MGPLRVTGDAQRFLGVAHGVKKVRICPAPSVSMCHPTAQNDAGQQDSMLRDLQYSDTSVDCPDTGSLTASMAKTAPNEAGSRCTSVVMFRAHSYALS